MDSLTRPKAVVFDLGKVLLDFDYGIVVRGIAERSSSSLEQLQALIDQSPLLYRYETGLISSAEFHETVRNATGYSGSFEDFASLFGNMFSEIEPMIRLNQNLRLAGVPTYIFSNTNELAIRHIRATYPFFRNFDDYILSYEHRAMKPDPNLYLVVERTTGLSGDTLLYIDDRLENVETGKQQGWQVVHHVDIHQTVERVRRKLLIGDVMM